ncbi:MAG TPA: helix-turn-helix domain-containing protein [Ktedonosporobacter sp.]|nr:helix-turn-helix domain-containing protein [Ktedonosporobacter sp.]
MLRSQTVLSIQNLRDEGKSVQEIAQELSISRTTVRKYLKHPEAVIRKPRPPQPSKLDPFKDQISAWVMEDHCTNCEVIFVRLQKLGFTGGISILKAYVHPLRPAVAGHAPIQRYETLPGEQAQFDWGEFVYEHEGKMHKFYGFTAVLGYSRMRFVTFVKRCDTPTLIRCLMEDARVFWRINKDRTHRPHEERHPGNGGKQTTLESSFCRFHGLYRGRRTGLQGVYAPNKRKSRAHRFLREAEHVGSSDLH